MISGAVVANRGPVVPIIIYDVNGGEHAYSAIVDTGFTGWLTLPKAIISKLGLPWRAQQSGILADGTEVSFRVYFATIIRDGQPTAVFVNEMDSEPSLGMSLLRGFSILIENVDGGAVQIERM